VARKKGTPSLTYERVWKAIRAGSLEVKRIAGTKMLLVVKGRVRLTWKVKGKLKHTRIRLNRIYLNPRWIALPKGYPVSKSKLRRLEPKERAALGIVLTEKNEVKLLIYQQLDDLYSLERQIDQHIKMRLSRESNKLWALLGRVSTQEPLKIVEQPALTGYVLGRTKQIDAINTHMSGRKSAVEARLEWLNKVRNLVRDSLEVLMELLPPDAKANGAIKGINKALSQHYKTLEELLDDKPFSHHARWARHHIKKAQGSLVVNDFVLAYKHLQKAIDYL
jgi:hypothetical protein